MIRPQHQINTLTIWSGVSMASSKSIWHNSDSFFCLKETFVFAFFSVCKGACCFQEKLPIDRFVDEH